MNTSPETVVPEAEKQPQTPGNQPGSITSDSLDRESWTNLTQPGNDSRDWRIWLGLILTFTYLVVIGRC